MNYNTGSAPLGRRFDLMMCRPTRPDRSERTSNPGQAHPHADSRHRRSAGYIGSHTVKQLLARGHDVTVFDNLSAGHRQAVPAERLIVGDLRDVDHVDHCSSSIASKR